MKTHNHPGLIGFVDHARRERLLSLYDLMRSSRNETIDLRWPDYSTIERAALNDFTNEGPKTLVTLSRQLSEYSQLIRAGVPMISEMEFKDLVLPTLDRSLTATFGGTSPDIGDQGVSAALPKPKRLSAYVVVSDQLRVQNPVLIGAWLEQQLLASIGRALDKAAIVGTGTNDQPLGIFTDGDILTNERATANTDTVADLTAMEKVIADANGEDSEDNYIFLADTGTRATLKSTAGINGPIWEKPGPLGHKAIASVHCAANSLALAQTSAMAFIDWNQLQVENLVDVSQAKQGFRTMLISGWFDFTVTDPNGVCKATNPA